MNHSIPLPSDLAQRYLDAWNASDPERRRALLSEVFSEDATYVDPMADVSGHEALDALIAGTQSKFGAARFVLKGQPTAHHDRLRFSWCLHGGGKSLAEGTDVAIVAADGRLSSVTGFLDYVDPAVAA